ncbi:MAG: hypothetical protein JO201_04810 [Verrucomicrobia bacterium]|nr:hypothetical protein [Verrucomicrobiota bacterium]
MVGGMSLLDRIERRFGFLGIPGLLRYVAAFSALVFIFYKFQPHYLSLIDLDPGAVRHGEVWRLVTYIFIPQLNSLIPAPDWFNAAFYVLFLIWVGDRLEQAWGSLRLNLFFLVGMIGTTIAAFFFGTQFSNVMLVSSIFFAFARFYPDVVIYFAYILPLKVKWMAWGYAAILLFQFLFGTMQFRSAVLAALANYLIFFGRDLFDEARHRREVSTRRQRFETEARQASSEPLHHCKTCGATESSDPDLEFRVARDGEEYCMKHLPSAQTAARL